MGSRMGRYAPLLLKFTFDSCKNLDFIPTTFLYIFLAPPYAPLL